MGELASVEKRKSRLLGEALGADDGVALAECGGKRGDEVVVEIENRGGVRGAASDAADLLDDVAFERDWGGKHKCVESREVHALAGDLRYGDECEAGHSDERFQGMNSQMQMLPTHQSMLGVFEPLWREAARGGGRTHLSTQDLRKIPPASAGGAGWWGSRLDLKTCKKLIVWKNQ